jgi:hypothetical protein
VYVAHPAGRKDGERWWILDPDGHAEYQARVALPEGMQSHGWVCTWCGNPIPTIFKDGSVRPIPVVEHATLCPACAVTVVADPSSDWNGGVCQCPPCQARRAKLYPEH